MPVRNAGETPERDAALAVPGLPVAQLNLLARATELGRGDRLQLRLHLLGRAQYGAGPDAREARRVVARGDRPRIRPRVQLGDNVDVGRIHAQDVADNLRGNGPVALSLRRRRHVDGDPAERIDADGGALRIPGLRQRLRPLGCGLRQRDVAHVRDRRLDHARNPDADEPAGLARRRLLVSPLLVAGELERSLQAGRVIAGVVETTRRGAIWKLVFSDEIPSCELGRIEPESPSRDRHRALEREVHLRSAEAAVQPGRAAIREHHAIPGRDVPHSVRTAQ